MKATRRLLLVSLTGTAIFAAASQALSQPKDLQKQIVGDWTLVSAYNEREGKKREPFGPRPEGYLHLGQNGRFAYLVFGKDAPKFAANDRTRATPEEAAAVVHSSIAYYGTYKVNQKDGTLEWNIEKTTFPNNKGLGKRQVTLSGDQMSLTNPGATAGGTNYFVWKRAK
ncbi:MAG: lipocalin-like domain-containing protein [Pseudomonadota bacterium]|nr:lipocalin-like domain-containing protein [Pseudomonadota bacterium]